MTGYFWGKKYGCKNNRIYLALKPTYEVVVVHPNFLVGLSVVRQSYLMLFLMSMAECQHLLYKSHPAG
jgi:hypothetical protein